MMEYDAIEYIKDEMEKRKLSRRDLLPAFGKASHMSEILNRKRGLPLSTIRALVFNFKFNANKLLIPVYVTPRAPQTQSS